MIFFGRSVVRIPSSSLYDVDDRLTAAAQCGVVRCGSSALWCLPCALVAYSGSVFTIAVALMALLLVLLLGMLLLEELLLALLLE